MKRLLLTLLLVSLICVILLLIDSSPKTESSSTSSEILDASGRDSVGKTQYEILQDGKTLFNNYCAACHNKNMKDELTGPALSKSIERWNSDTLGMLLYVRSSQLYFTNKPSNRMVKLHKQYKNIEKPNFEKLTIAELKSIIEYIEMRYHLEE